MCHIHHEGLQDEEKEEKDVIKARPGRFDTALLVVSNDAEQTGVKGTQVGRVKVIFKIPDTLDTKFGPQAALYAFLKEPFVYIEWYSSFAPSARERNRMMYEVRTMDLTTQGR